MRIDIFRPWNSHWWAILAWRPYWYNTVWCQLTSILAWINNNIYYKLLVKLLIHSQTSVAGLILALRPANERRHYKVAKSLTGWAQTYNPPCSGCTVEVREWLSIFIPHCTGHVITWYGVSFFSTNCDLDNALVTAMLYGISRFIVL